MFDKMTDERRDEIATLLIEECCPVVTFTELLELSLIPDDDRSFPHFHSTAISSNVYGDYELTTARFLTASQALWAANHDWFVSDQRVVGGWQVIVRNDNYVPGVNDDEESETLIFDNYALLRKWAGY